MTVKPITYVKLLLDILMVLVFALLFNTRVFSGLAFYEIAGLALGGVFIIHLALNGKWIKQLTVNLMNPKISSITKMRYVIDVLLLLSMAFIVVSGVMISKTVLIGVFKASNDHLFRELHIVVSYVSLLLIGIHVGLCWSWVMNQFQRIFRKTQKGSALGKLGIAAVVLTLGFGSYTVYAQTKPANISIVQSNGSENQVSGERSGFTGSPPNGAWAGGRHGEGGDRGGGGANVFSVLVTQLGIISAFSAMTVYGLKRQSKNNSGPSAA